MVSTYSLPGTTLPKKKLEIGEYAIACLGPGTTLPKKWMQFCHECGEAFDIGKPQVNPCKRTIELHQNN